MAESGRVTIVTARTCTCTCTLALLACLDGEFLCSSPVAAQVAAPNRLADLRTAKAAVVAAETATPPDKDKITGLQEAYGIQQSFAGDSAGAMATLDMVRNARGHRPRGKPSDISNYASAQAEDAIKAIVAAARNKRAVLINESHHNPMNRAFAQKLAHELRKIGFSYLACETFYTDVSAQPKYLTPAHGYYINEPVFAAFVDSAIKDGWKLIPYESEEDDDENASMDARGERREFVQARNLYERIYAKDKNAKALIYVGYGHVAKANIPKLENMMGTLLRQKLGEKATLHVDQVEFNAHADRSRESPLYRPLLARFPSSAPFVLRQKDGEFATPSGYENYVDMQVVFPDYGLQNGRPQWLSTLAGRQPQAIPAALLPAKGERLILAYDKQHGPDAVPIDAVLVEAGSPAPSLMLPETEVRLEIQE